MNRTRLAIFAAAALLLLGAAGHRGGLVAPYSKMTTLTPEQKDKILVIHQKALDEMRQVKEREASAIWAVLGPLQRSEFRAIKDGAVFTPPAATQPSSGQLIISISGPSSTQPATTQPTP